MEGPVMQFFLVTNTQSKLEDTHIHQMYASNVLTWDKVYSYDSFPKHPNVIAEAYDTHTRFLWWVRGVLELHV